MGKGSLPMLFLSLWVVFFGLLGVYQFDGPRHFVLQALERRDALPATALSQTSSYTAAVYQAAPRIVLPTYANATGTPVSLPVQIVLPAPAPVAPAPVVETPPVTYQYRLIENIDTCTLNKLGAQGWNATQFGGTLVPNTYGYDDNCKNGGLRTLLDWVLLEKVTSTQ